MEKRNSKKNNSEANKGWKKAEREEIDRKRNAWRLEMRVVTFERRVEVVVKPGGWFSKRQTVMERREEEGEKLVLVNELGEVCDHFTFSRLPAGSFTMGSPVDETERNGLEIEHKVSIAKGFDLMIYPVTQALWLAVMGSNPSKFKGPDLPVESVSWNDVQTFIGKLNKTLGIESLRLPTEAEWEYACRAGTTTPFWTGQNLTTDQANYDGTNPLRGYPAGGYRRKTIPVTLFEPNPWGLHDMHGNVWEFCNDWIESYTSSFPLVDPAGPPSGIFRVMRGGSWRDPACLCRSARRSSIGPHNAYSWVGFRLASSRNRRIRHL